MSESLQDRFGPETRCFGCGPSNPRGLQIKTFMVGDEGVCDFEPDPCHEAFDGYVAGGIIGVVFDCHCNWTGAHHLMVKNGLVRPPATVTAEYAVTFLKPTPSGAPLRFLARVVESSGRKAIVEGRLEAGGETTATCRGVFVSVGLGHPAFERW